MLHRGPGGPSGSTPQQEPQVRETALSLSKRQWGNLQDAGFAFQEVNFLENLHWRNLALKLTYKELGLEAP